MSIPRRAKNMTAKDRALSAKQGPTPASAMMPPATAGPTMRAQWTMTLLRLTAVTTRSAPTISETNAWRAGLSKAVTIPRRKTRT